LPIPESEAQEDVHIEEEKETESCTIVEIQEKIDMDFESEDDF